MNPLLNTATKAALSAGKIITRYYENLPDNSVQRKNGHDFVTAVDKMAEDDIVQLLRKSYPSHGIISEESEPLNGTDDYTWIIDPLDGTVNFIHGVPHFCVSIAMQYKDRVNLAVIYDPIRQDLFTATRGHGAQLNNRRLRVAKKESLEDALIACSLPRVVPERATEQLATLNTFYKQISGMRHTGSAALDLAYVAAGRLDAFWETPLEVWDVAAGGLLVEEAGGFVSDWFGNPDYLNQGSVIAANPKLFKQLLPVIQKGFK
jgi:myo-inositol-1(or 4)-monophosphatase